MSLLLEISSLEMLHSDDVLIREIECYSLSKGSIECGSCLSRDLSVAHCSTCSSYLCAKCSQAHEYMKCFEQHQVRHLNKDSPSSSPRENPTDTFRHEFVGRVSQIGEMRRQALANVDHQLTSLQNEFEKSKTNIDGAYEQYQQILKEIHVSLSLLSMSDLCLL